MCDDMRLGRVKMKISTGLSVQLSKRTMGATKFTSHYWGSAPPFLLIPGGNEKFISQVFLCWSNYMCVLMPMLFAFSTLVSCCPADRHKIVIHFILLHHFGGHIRRWCVSRRFLPCQELNPYNLVLFVDSVKLIYTLIWVERNRKM